MQGNIRNNWETGSEAFMQSPHVATAAVEEPLRQAWSSQLRNVTLNVPHGGSAVDLISKQLQAYEFTYANIRTVRVETEIPVVRTVCIPSHDLSSNLTNLPFPVLPEYDFWYWHKDGEGTGNGTYGNGPVRDFPLPVTIGTIWPVPPADPVAEAFSVRSMWIPLSDEFGSATTGLVLLFLPSNSTFGNALSCTIDARWSRGQNWLISSASDWDRAVSLEPMQSTPATTRFVENVDNWLFLPSADGNWRRIAATPEYLNALTPPVSDDSNTTTLESLILRGIPSIVQTWYQNDLHFSNASATFVPFIEHIISTLVVDGIARTGSYLQQNPIETLMGLTINPEYTDLNSSVVLELISLTSNMTNTTSPLRMDTSIEGYAYMLSGFPTYLAVALLLLHILIATLHTIWMLRTRKTSSSWSSITELIVLAQDSTPVEAFRNTAAGITSLSTFALPGRISVIDSGSSEHLELLWSEWSHNGDDSSHCERKVDVDQAY